MMAGPVSMLRRSLGQSSGASQLNLTISRPTFAGKDDPAIFGWNKMNEAERYTRAAHQKVIAGRGCACSLRNKARAKVSHLFFAQACGGTLFGSKSMKNLG